MFKEVKELREDGTVSVVWLIDDVTDKVHQVEFYDNQQRIHSKDWLNPETGLIFKTESYYPNGNIWERYAPHPTDVGKAVHELFSTNNKSLNITTIYNSERDIELVEHFGHDSRIYDEAELEENENPELIFFSPKQNDPLQFLKNLIDEKKRDKLSKPIRQGITFKEKGREDSRTD